MNYYNENDPKAAAWLRQLIAQGELPTGIVDERSIADVRKSDLSEFIQFHTFCGVGGWPLALKLAGIPNDFPCWTGSCLCQPFSQSGAGKVDSDERHLWPAFRTVIAECRPPVIFGEQVASKDGRIWLAGVRADMEALGYVFGAADLCAASIGAPHIRQRLYWMAYAKDADGRREFNAEGTQCRRCESGGNSEHGRMAEAASGGLGIDGSTPREFGHADLRGEVERVADTDGERRTRESILLRAKDSEPEGSQEIHETSRSGDAGGVGDTDDTRLQRWGLQLGSDAGQQPTWATGFEIVRCTDGKTRRFECGSFPLVDGLSKGVVRGGDCGLPNIQNTSEARVMRLRGYGNAIVPELAAQFILACMDVLRFDLK